MSQDPEASPASRIHLEADASGYAHIYQVGQGTMVVGGGQARAAAVIVPVVGQKVGAPTVFVGRQQSVGKLLSLVNPTQPGPVATVVSAVAGLAGVGKTTLARHVAAVAVERGWFPGGAVMVDLRGYDPAGHIEPIQMFGPLVRALGVPGVQIPSVEAEQAATYHQVLAELARQDRSVLLVLDNASSPDQVLDLLPVHRSHRVMVTSRHTLGDLPGVRIVELDVLSLDEAVAMLEQTLRRRNPDDSRIADQPEQAVQLTELCGRLPLALQIIAALLADDATSHLSDLVADLNDISNRLASLEYGNRAVATAFDLSYQRLDAAEALLFRLLTVNPGPDITGEAAAVLTNRSHAATRGLLRALRRSHLIEQSTATDRWRMHDLVHLYATRLALAQADQDGHTAAIQRLLDYYLTITADAYLHLRALPGQATPDRFASRAEALAWLDAERSNLIAAVDLASQTGYHRIVVALSNGLGAFLRWRRHLSEWVAIAHQAVVAARQLDNHHGEGATLTNLGAALRQMRRFEEAIDAHQQAVAIHRKTGDDHGRGVALDNLGLVLTDAHRFEQAIDAHQQAAAVFQEIGDRHGEGVALNNLGIALRQVQQIERATTACRQAIAIYRETGDRHGEGIAFDNLGAALRQGCQFEQAITTHEQATAIFRETGDRHDEGIGLTNLGVALAEVGRLDQAIDAHQRAVTICREASDRHSEGIALTVLGSALAKAGRFENAIDVYEQAVAAFEASGDRLSEGNALTNLGLALAEVERFEDAVDAHQRVVTICRVIGDHDGEGAALTNLGTALVEVERFEDAIDVYEQAVAVFEATGNRHDGGVPLGHLGLALAEVGRFEQAIDTLQSAITIFRETGDRHQEGVVLANLGLVLQKTGHSVDARRCWLMAEQVFANSATDECR